MIYLLSEMCTLWWFLTVQFVIEHSLCWQPRLCPVNEESNVLLSEQFMDDHEEWNIMNKLNFEWPKFCEWISVVNVNTLMPGRLLRNPIIRNATIWQLLAKWFPISNVPMYTCILHMIEALHFSLHWQHYLSQLHVSHGCWWHHAPLLTWQSLVGSCPHQDSHPTWRASWHNCQCKLIWTFANIHCEFSES